jgi:glutamate-5-semialdehyde dehydrogenase
LEHELKLKKIKAAAKQLRLADVKKRNLVLKRAADLLLKSTKEVLAANALDLDSLDKSVTASFRDRLVLNEMRIKHMALSLKQVAALADPLATESKIKILKNGLKLKKVRAPLGVVFMIFESRPNVAFEAFSMGFKSGNAMILRGGKESQRTTKVLYDILEKSIKSAGLPADVLWGITDSDREIVNQLLTQKEYIDVVVPRGGEGLINFVVENSLIPIIKNDRGLCHVYVNDDAKLDMAVDILVNAKTQRPAVCNSMETILVHRKIAGKLLPKVYERMQKFNVQWFGCHETRKILKKYPHVLEATEINYNTEYLEQIVNCKVVSGVTEAMEHIEKFGSRHSECIVTQKVKLARQFQNEVDAAVVYWNASTRFTDGFEFGLGGELGISTQKLHVRGPVGLQALTNERWVVDGKGQIRS